MKLVLFNQKEIELTPEETELIKQRLLDRRTQFIEIGSQIINVKDIRGVFESEGTLHSFKKLPEPKLEKAVLSDRMKENWNLLKSRGLFREFNSYEEFRQAKGY